MKTVRTGDTLTSAVLMTDLGTVPGRSVAGAMAVLPRRQFDAVLLELDLPLAAPGCFRFQGAIIFADYTLKTRGYAWSRRGQHAKIVFRS